MKETSSIVEWAMQLAAFHDSQVMVVIKIS